VVGLWALASAQRGGLDARAIGGDGTACPMGAREVGASGRVWTKAADGRIVLLTHRPAVDATRWDVLWAARRRGPDMGCWAGMTVLCCLGNSPAFGIPRGPAEGNITSLARENIWWK
jgi:hypothetical protein